MNRRNFLSLVALGAPAAVIAPKLGLIERARKYFFAPSRRKCGSLPAPTLYGGARSGGKVLSLKGWRVGPDRILSHDGRTLWAHYTDDGSLGPGWVRYRLSPNGRISTEFVTVHNLFSA